MRSSRSRAAGRKHDDVGASVGCIRHPLYQAHLFHLVDRARDGGGLFSLQGVGQARCESGPLVELVQGVPLPGRDAVARQSVFEALREHVASGRRDNPTGRCGGVRPYQAPSFARRYDRLFSIIDDAARRCTGALERKKQSPPSSKTKGPSLAADFAMSRKRFSGSRRSAKAFTPRARRTRIAVGSEALHLIVRSNSSSSSHPSISAPERIASRLTPAAKRLS